MRTSKVASGFPGIVMAVGIMLGLTVTTGRAGDSRENAHGIIPIWSLKNSKPFILLEDSNAQSTLNSELQSCAPVFDFSVLEEYIAVYFDSSEGLTKIFGSDPANDQTIVHMISKDLVHTDSVLTLDGGAVWAAEDLDQDGNVELVTQFGATLSIYSSPDWQLRGQFTWPGYNVVMNPVVFQLDTDEYYEIFVAPVALSGVARAVVIDYDAVGDSFYIKDDIVAPAGAGGEPAVGDFDQDGRVEFITGSFYSAYSMFEWQDSGLVYIGHVGGPPLLNDFTAATVWPVPDGKPHPLLAFSSGTGFYRYELLTAIGDNQFETLHIFQKQTFAIGRQPCHGADVDCDGLDEIVMAFWPNHEVWHWDISSSTWVQGCVRHQNAYGTIPRWHTVDLDQNGEFEWGTINHLKLFQMFPDDSCLSCETSGQCHVIDYSCICSCNGDPVCDSVSDVFDVLAVVEVAFRNGIPEPDPFAQCPVDRTDVTCDSVTDVFDVLAVVAVAFQNSDPTAEFCDPCE